MSQPGSRWSPVTATETRSIADVAAAAGIPAHTGTSIDGPVGTAASLHLACALPAVTWGSELFGPLLMRAEHLATPLRYEGGAAPARRARLRGRARPGRGARVLPELTRPAALGVEARPSSEERVLWRARRGVRPVRPVRGYGVAEAGLRCVSTRVRACPRRGEVRGAARALGRPHHVEGAFRPGGHGQDRARRRVRSLPGAPRRPGAGPGVGQRRASGDRARRASAAGTGRCRLRGLSWPIQRPLSTPSVVRAGAGGA
ncbi:enolase C-terminal domain-like protein [Amycolatopsis thermoflava]|uniref:enolase C-terminal domain-like protein n=1 Tax=Amycolatopsis thermoflava TaxID=84480 RepID=UPI0036607BD7